MTSCVTGETPAWWRPPTPYEPGNLAAVKHGAGSSRLVEARAELVRHEVLSVAPWLDDPCYSVAVHRALRVEARSLLLDEWIGHVAAEQGPGKVSSRLWEQANATDRLAAQLWSELGLDPAGRAKLKMLAAGGVHAERSLADLMAEGQAAIDAQEAGQ